MILDTNVLSELTKPARSETVLSFVARQPPGTLHISIVTKLELERGISLLPEGRRRAALAAGVSDVLARLIGPRIIPFGIAEQAACVRLLETRRRAGRPLDDHPFDAMIAATVTVAKLPLATQNLDDFEGLGLLLIDPWTA